MYPASPCGFRTTVGPVRVTTSMPLPSNQRMTELRVPPSEPLGATLCGARRIFNSICRELRTSRLLRGYRCSSGRIFSTFLTILTSLTLTVESAQRSGLEPVLLTAISAALAKPLQMRMERKSGVAPRAKPNSHSGSPSDHSAPAYHGSDNQPLLPYLQDEPASEDQCRSHTSRITISIPWFAWRTRGMAARWDGT